MKGSIDRIENNTAVVETNNGFVEIALSDLPEGAKEGSIIEFLSDGKYGLLNDEEDKIRKENYDLLNSLFKN